MTSPRSTKQEVVIPFPNALPENRSYGFPATFDLSYRLQFLNYCMDEMLRILRKQQYQPNTPRILGNMLNSVIRVLLQGIPGHDPIEGEKIILSELDDKIVQVNVSLPNISNQFNLALSTCKDLMFFTPKSQAKLDMEAVTLESLTNQLTSLQPFR